MTKQVEVWTSRTTPCASEELDDAARTGEKKSVASPETSPSPSMSYCARKR